MNFFYWIGVVGAMLILLGFLLRQHKKYGIGTIPYEIINLVGSFLLVLYAVDGKTVPFIILNVVWVTNSAFSLTKLLRKTKHSIPIKSDKK